MTYFSEMQQEVDTTNVFLCWRFVCNTETHLCSVYLSLGWLVFVKEIPYFEFPPDFAPQTDQIMCSVFS